METWKSVLKADPTDWLLEESNPSVRFFTLIDLLDIPADSAECLKARQMIMQQGPARLILEKQQAGGYWEKSEDFYEHSKYKGTVWQLIVLAESGADGRDERIRKAGEFILTNSQDRESGGFSIFGNPESGGDHSHVIPCLTGNMVFSLIRLGFENDARLKNGIEWIAGYQRFDDKIDKAPSGWPYDVRYRCWGRHTCSMGAVKSLKALAEVPDGMRTDDVKKSIAAGADYFLLHHVFKRSHNPEKVCKEGWTSFGFPLMYQTDALEIGGLLGKLGYRDPRMQECIDLVISKQNEQGRWNLETSVNGRLQVNIEVRDKPSKWITLNALRLLKHYLGN